MQTIDEAYAAHLREQLMQLPKQSFKIADLQMPLTFYPRQHVHKFVVDKYVGYLKAGAKFPAIVVGKLHNHFIIVDGWHRTNAYIRLKIKYIIGVLKEYTSERDLFVDAVILNQAQGYSLTKTDRKHSVKRLRRYKFSIDEIVKLTSVAPQDVTRTWDKSTKISTMAITGPGGRRIDIPVIHNPIDDIRLRVVEALGITDNDEVYEVVAAYIQNGKSIMIPVTNAADDIRKPLEEALNLARSHNLYDVTMVLERALTMMNGTMKYTVTTPIS